MYAGKDMQSPNQVISFGYGKVGPWPDCKPAAGCKTRHLTYLSTTAPVPKPPQVNFLYLPESRENTVLEKRHGTAQNARVSKQLSLEELQQEAIAFRREYDAVMLSTTSPEGMPDASYAPCFLDSEDRCHVLISQLAQHTKNLVSHPMASLMWIEDRESSRNAFARRRLVLLCRAEHIERGSKEWDRLIEQMADQLGNTVDLLAGLPDFMLFRFSAIEGNYVRGFAQAHPVTGNDLVMAERRTR